MRHPLNNVSLTLVTGSLLPPKVPSAESEDASGKGYKPDHAARAYRISAMS